MKWKRGCAIVQCRCCPRFGVFASAFVWKSRMHLSSFVWEHLRLAARAMASEEAPPAEVYWQSVGKTTTAKRRS